jgi:uncharacterized membrane protein
MFKIISLFSAIGAMLLFTKCLFILNLRWYVSFLGVCLFCFSNPLIEYAYYNKPYTLELFYNVLLLYLTICYSKDSSESTLKKLLVTSSLASLFAFNALFYLPGIFIFLLTQRGDKKFSEHFTKLFKYGFACIVIVGLQYAIYLSIWDSSWFFPDLQRTIREYPYSFYIGEYNLALLNWLKDGFQLLTEYLLPNFFKYNFTEYLPNWITVVRRNAGIIIFNFAFFSFLISFFSKKTIYFFFAVITTIVYIIFGIGKIYWLGPLRTNIFYLTSFVLLTIYFFFMVKKFIDFILNKNLTIFKVLKLVLEAPLVLLAIIICIHIIPFDFTNFQPLYIRQEGRAALLDLVEFARDSKFLRVPLVTNMHASGDIYYFTKFDNSSIDKTFDFNKRFSLFKVYSHDLNNFLSTINDGLKSDSDFICLYTTWNEFEQVRSILDLENKGIINFIWGIEHNNASAACGKKL